MYAEITQRLQKPIHVYGSEVLRKSQNKFIHKMQKIKKSIRLRMPYVRIISTTTKAKPQPRHAVPPQQSFSNSSNH